MTATHVHDKASDIDTETTIIDNSFFYPFAVSQRITDIIFMV